METNNNAEAPQPKAGPRPMTVEEIHSASQRQVNLLWERTQASIAILVVVSYVVGAFWMPGNITLASAFFLIIGFYFGRTNHTRVGGIQPPTLTR